MCDYSLHAQKERAARVGDTLITTTYANTHTRGLRLVGGDPNEAVCLLPGTEVAFTEPPYRDSSFLSYLPSRQITKECVAKFVKIDQDNLLAHHDAFEFSDGSIVLVHALSTDQHVTVLQLPVIAQPARPDVEETPTPRLRRVEDIMPV